MAAAAEWATSSNEALEIKLVRREGDKSESDGEEMQTFHPEFTYPIFGESETLYGYRGLSIKLYFASGSLAQYVDVSYKAKNETTTAKVDDVEGTLFKFIPPDYTKSASAFASRVADDAASFRPLGERIASYTRPSSAAKGKGKGRERNKDAVGERAVNGSAKLKEEEGERVFELYRATWDTKGFREYHRRMQIFALLYIEGASYIQEDEENWEFVTLYERQRTSETGPNGEPVFIYHFVGYTSLFPFWCWPDSQRMRLSQFVILPPYQRQGHGSSLYGHVFTYILNRASVSELTVEDPSEIFEDLRDVNDLSMLLRPGGLVEQEEEKGAKSGLRAPVDKTWMEKTRKEYKLAARQFHRLIEMLLLRGLDTADDRQLRAYRLQVKERLFRFNRDVLTQLPKEERIQKLAETYDSVVEDYVRILAVVGVQVDVEKVVGPPPPLPGIGIGIGASGTFKSRTGLA